MTVTTVTTVNPATGQALGSYEETTPEGIDRILDTAGHAAARWAELTPQRRAGHLHAIALGLRDRRDELALLATREMGKPLRESRAEVDKCAWSCEWFADHAPALLEPQTVATGAVRALVSSEPLGVLFAIMPWNFPYWQVIRALAPALAAGNVVVLKHAPSTTGSALALAEVVSTAVGADGSARESDHGPAGLLSVVVAGVETTPAVSERIIIDDRVAAVTLTGSTAAGRAVAAVAGRALKKTVLELGGSDPFIVLADADLPAAADWAVRSRFQNAGQSCIAAKRIIAERAVADELTTLLVDRVERLELGDPTAPDTTVGPLAREDLRDAVDRQVRDSVALGARVLTGGSAPPRDGFFYEPTLLDRVTPEMPVLREEVFGPAAPIVTVPDAESAVAVANATRFGLGSNLWTSDLERGEALAHRLHAGHTAINGMTQSDARLPFGGVKDSGYGRELSAQGLHEFVNVHTVVVEAPPGPSGPVVASE